MAEQRGGRRGPVEPLQLCHVSDGCRPHRRRRVRIVPVAVKNLVGETVEIAVRGAMHHRPVAGIGQTLRGLPVVDRAPRRTPALRVNGGKGDGLPRRSHRRAPYQPVTSRRAVRQHLQRVACNRRHPLCHRFDLQRGTLKDDQLARLTGNRADGPFHQSLVEDLFKQALVHDRADAQARGGAWWNGNDKLSVPREGKRQRVVRPDHHKQSGVLVQRIEKLRGIVNPIDPDGIGVIRLDNRMSGAGCRREPPPSRQAAARRRERRCRPRMRRARGAGDRRAAE